MKNQIDFAEEDSTKLEQDKSFCEKKDENYLFSVLTFFISGAIVLFLIRKFKDDEDIDMAGIKKKVVNTDLQVQTQIDLIFRYLGSIKTRFENFKFNTRIQDLKCSFLVASDFNKKLNNSYQNIIALLNEAKYDISEKSTISKFNNLIIDLNNLFKSNEAEIENFTKTSGRSISELNFFEKTISKIDEILVDLEIFDDEWDILCSSSVRND